MRPTRLALLALAVWTALAVGASLSDAFTPLWATAGMTLAALLAADGWRLYSGDCDIDALHARGAGR